MTKFSAVQKPLSGPRTVVLFAFSKQGSGQSSAYARITKTHQKSIRPYFLGKAGEVFFLAPTTTKGQPVLCVGLGDPKAFSVHVFARACRLATRALQQHHVSQALFVFPQMDFSSDQLLFMAVHNVILAQYAFTLFKKSKDKPIASVAMLLPELPKNSKAIITEASIIAEEINNARDLGNMPGADMTPIILADHAKRDGKAAGFSVTSYDEKKMKTLGMGAILGVSRGSDEEARFIICEYKPAHPINKKPLVYVGKGVTFDTGGLNLKPDMSMYEMHLDMCGGAAVIHAMAAIARLKLPVHVVGLIPSVENMPGGSGYRPGDILRSYSGKTIEVRHTDAEGRIILADALGYAKIYNPEVVIDVATLTGAAVVALGQRASAVMSTDEALLQELVTLGDSTGDRTWPMPLWDEYSSDVEGTFGDVMNIGKTRYGGTITAAAFLREFAPIAKWAHIDIAPTMSTIEEEYLAKGARGAGVHLLVAFAKTYVEKHRAKN